jgi:hypothetical protein
VPTVHLSSDQDNSQHPFGDQAATSCKFVALGFASQPYDWFAFSRMMTLAGPLDTESASDRVGQASRLTVDEWCQAKSLTYGSEDEFRAARDLAITCLGADVTTRHASTPQTYVRSDRSQTKDLRQFRKIPQVRNGAARIQQN